MIRGSFSSFSRTDNNQQRCIPLCICELIFEVPDHFSDEDIKPIIEVMEETTKISVPLKVEYGFGSNWREAH